MDKERREDHHSKGRGEVWGASTTCVDTKNNENNNHFHTTATTTTIYYGSSSAKIGDLDGSNKSRPEQQPLIADAGTVSSAAAAAIYYDELFGGLPPACCERRLSPQSLLRAPAPAISALLTEKKKIISPHRDSSEGFAASSLASSTTASPSSLDPSSICLSPPLRRSSQPCQSNHGDAVVVSSSIVPASNPASALLPPLPDDPTRLWAEKRRSLRAAEPSSSSSQQRSLTPPPSCAHSPVRFLRRASAFRKRHHHGFRRRASNFLLTMGNCCGGRDDAAIKQEAAKAKRMENFFGRAEKTDAEKFDDAYSHNDIPGYVAVIDSTDPIDEPEEPMHPWAANPQTVGALAMTQLAVLASKDEAVKDKIREAGAIPLLIKYLNSDKQDRVHAAVLALSFLSVENPKNCTAMFEGGAMPSLIRLMTDKADGVRGATAQTCRNIYVLSLAYRRAFIKEGGVVALVKLLELPEGDIDNPENDLFNQQEAVYHLEDLVLENAEEIPEFVTAVKSEGAHRALEPLAKIEANKDLAGAAHYLFVRLAD